MSFSLHNAATRTRETFAPSEPGHVRMYVCGPTVYDRAHIGNARAEIVYDTLVRVLRHVFGRVTYVRNVTDVDDKINAKAAETGRTIGDVTTETLALFHADMARLDVLPPDAEPRATAFVPAMIAIAERLIASGHAYAAEGHVLFSVRSFAGYGALSGRDPEALLAGARVDVAPYKRDPGDFVLWKPSAPALPGWESPWGRGRPGWHIECSAMSHAYLGETFDIHGGGTDLLFPHHENERAQSLCAFPGSGFARVWLHHGMLRVGGQKMSKSLGNVLLLPDLLARAPAEAIRLALLKTHYRAELDFTDAGLADAKRELDRFYRALAGYAHIGMFQDDGVLAALGDDLNTPGAVAAMHGLADAALAGDAGAAGRLRGAGALLGVLGMHADAWFQGDSDPVIAQRIEARAAAKAARQFAVADEIRAALLADGIVLEDSPKGTTWRRT